jgi:hypothetical protein
MLVTLWLLAVVVVADKAQTILALLVAVVRVDCEQEHCL